MNRIGFGDAGQALLLFALLLQKGGGAVTSTCLLPRLGTSFLLWVVVNMMVPFRVS